MFVTRLGLAKPADLLTDEQRAQLSEARARAGRLADLLALYFAP
jgi:hypothetical protein